MRELAGEVSPAAAEAQLCVEGAQTGGTTAATWRLLFSGPMDKRSCPAAAASWCLAGSTD